MDTHARRYDAWAERQYLRHTLVATLTHDPPTAERASAVLADDKPPPAPFRADEDEDRWSEARLEADMLLGTRWPFFRETSLDSLNGQHDDVEGPDGGGL